LVHKSSTDPSCVRNINWPLSRRGLGHVTQFRNFGSPVITFEQIKLPTSNSVQKSTTDPSCVRNINWLLSGRILGHVTQFRNFGTPPQNVWTNNAINFKFGTQIEHGPFLRSEHKLTPKWAWPGSRDPISKFRDPLITFERIMLSTSNLVQKSRTDPSCVRNINWPLSGRVLGHVTQFRNFGPPHSFWNLNE